MSVNISKLKEERTFEDDKLKITFSCGLVSNSLSVFIKDENGKNHHILLEISPDRLNRSFDKTNLKIKEFVKNKIAEWVSEIKEAEKLKKEFKRKKELAEKNNLKRLIDSF